MENKDQEPPTPDSPEDTHSEMSRAMKEFTEMRGELLRKSYKIEAALDEIICQALFGDSEELHCMFRRILLDRPICALPDKLEITRCILRNKGELFESMSTPPRQLDDGNFEIIRNIQVVSRAKKVIAHGFPKYVGENGKDGNGDEETEAGSVELFGNLFQEDRTKAKRLTPGFFGELIAKHDRIIGELERMLGALNG